MAVGVFGRAWLIALLVLAGCGPGPGLREMRTYGSAFEQVQSSSERLLDELAGAERALVRDVGAQAGASGPADVNQTFDPAQAGTFGMDSEPPLTKSYRRALRIVGSYNSALLDLAEGRPLDGLQQDAARLGLELAATVGGSAVPGLGAALPLLKLALEEAAAAASRAAFRDAFLRQFDVVDGLLREMRAGTAQMFPILTRANLARIRRARIERAPAPELAALVAAHESYRTALSDWVLSIDETRTAMREVKAALEAPAGAIRADELPERAARLKLYAAAVRSALNRARDVAP